MCFAPYTVQQFNAGVFDTLIAVDNPKTAVVAPTSQPKASTKPPIKSLRRIGGENGRKRSQTGGNTADELEFGVTRGVDFFAVRCVVNYDMPDTPQVNGIPWVGLARGVFASWMENSLEWYRSIYMSHTSMLRYVPYSMFY